MVKKSGLMKKICFVMAEAYPVISGKGNHVGGADSLPCESLLSLGELESDTCVIG